MRASSIAAGLDALTLERRRGSTAPGEELLGRYRRYLISERGLVAGTVANYQRVARLFLSTLSIRNWLRRVNSTPRT